MSLQYRKIFFHVKRKAMTNVYISPSELRDAVKNLTSTEINLYSLLYESVLKNPLPEYYDNKSLAKELGLSVGSVKNAKVGLKKKGYAIIVNFKDEHGDPCLRVILGKDQVELYNLGLKVEISDAKSYKQLLDRFPLTDPKLSKEERDEMVIEANEYYKSL